MPLRFNFCPHCQNKIVFNRNETKIIPIIQPPTLPDAAKIFPIPFSSCEPNVKTKPIMTNVIIPSIILFFLFIQI